jgi:hypothetical protein
MTHQARRLASVDGSGWTVDVIVLDSREWFEIKRYGYVMGGGTGNRATRWPPSRRSGRSSARPLERLQ